MLAQEDLAITLYWSRAYRLPRDFEAMVLCALPNIKSQPAELEVDRAISLQFLDELVHIPNPTDLRYFRIRFLTSIRYSN